ncbi:PTS sugar transporter subunit IIB, partial [Eubacteriales bacterium OttesenSCG-928-M02]|nr:PTS sugar transporter subunit IIB [Eubacteriales bacterium OttesenSCG-928-M02]
GLLAGCILGIKCKEMRPMVKSLRVDDRLVHGQVCLGWTKALNTGVLLVANDNAANNEAVKTACKMSAPAGVKLSVQEVQKAITTLNDPRSKNAAIFMIVRTVADAVEVINGLEDPSIIERLNLGNFGHNQDTGHDDNNKKLADNVYVTPEEIEMLKGVQAKGVSVDVQLLPYLPYKSFDDALK